MKDLIIIGSGPAGLSAAIYAARFNLDTVVIEGTNRGGRIVTTSSIENYPGVLPLDGSSLMDLFFKQATNFGVNFLSSTVTKVDLLNYPFKVFADQENEAKSIIIATGSRNKTLGLDHEKELIGKGISFCATCDGFFMRDKIAYVIGGGDTAVHEALHLTNFAKEVYLVHRRDSLRAQDRMQEKLKKSKVKMVWNAIVSKYITTEGNLSAIELTFTDNHKEIRNLDGLFLSIGNIPNTEFLDNQLELKADRHIIVSATNQTNVSGVFAAGDVCDPDYKQVIVASGMGAISAINVAKFLKF